MEGPRSATLAPGRTESHRVTLAVWDVPTPVEGGSSIQVKVGARCDHACRISESAIEVKDAEGNTVATGMLGDSPFSGTRALYWTEVRFAVPPELGLHNWEASISPDCVPSSHLNVGSRFSVLVTERARFRLSLTVTDGATRDPLANAYVRVGGHTLFTDDKGKAETSVSPGEQELVAWKRDHKMSRSKIVVERDGQLVLELTPYPCKYCPDRTG